MVSRKDVVNLFVALVLLLLIICIFLWFFEPEGPIYDTGLLKMIFSGIGALGLLFGVMKKFRVGTISSQTLSRQVGRFVSGVGNDDTDASRERIQFPPTNQAAPLTEMERRREGTQFRPYEVLDHMQRDARQNLYNDALTQTIELWKNRREEQYRLLNDRSGVDITNFKAETKTDDNGPFDINIIMPSTKDSNEEIIELAKQFRHHFENRIILLAQLHDSIPPGK